MPRAASSPGPGRPSLTLAAPLVVAALAGCPQEEIVIEGEFGRPLALGTGDASPLPRLAFRPGECRGESGGCSSVCTAAPEQCPADACLPLLVDSGSPITTLVGEGDPAAIRGCFELRSAADLFAEPPVEGAAERAIPRFRFESTPFIRLPRAAADVVWGWQIGNQSAAPFVGGVLGGNVLRQMAVRFSDARGGEAPQITLYREFPGSESILADQGSAALPLQFPGLLLGKLIDDVCQQPDGEDCDLASFGVFDREHPESALQSTRLVLDACLGPPPAAVIRDPGTGRCALAAGPGKSPSRFRTPTGASGKQVSNGCSVDEVTLKPGDIDHGHDASVLIATGIPGLVLFEDSALRMFGRLDLPKCVGDGGIQSGDVLGTPACLEGHAGILRAPGWPAAGTAERPLVQLRVRSLALVPGLTQTTGATACQRLEVRLRALRSQCNLALQTKVPRGSADNCRLDPAAEPGSAAAETAAVVGQAFVADGGRVDPGRWIPTLVVPADHPLATAVRRDTSPEALQLDGLVGTALLRGTDVVLDYTDPTPSVRVACNDPDDGTCLAMPSCVPREDPSAVVPACCFGLPEELLVSLIRDESAYGCCAALSPATVEELNNAEATAGRELPCPVR